MSLSPPAQEESRNSPARLRLYFYFILSATGLIGIGIAAMILTLIRTLDYPGPLSQSRHIVIPIGLGLNAIGEILYGNNVIENPLLFRAAAFYRGVASNLKAGEYEFEPESSINHVIDTLVAGRSVQHALTLPEGLTTKQMIARLRADPRLSGTLTKTYAEGSYLPETYYIERGTAREAIMARMAQAMTDYLNAIWKNRAPGLPLKSPEEALILASIVEREPNLPHEHARIAAVFINRIRRGMRLQADPTVLYAVSDGLGILERPLSRADLALESPYNTYHVHGLPPTPISNPGKAALDAVLHPEKHSPYIYFVADGKGGHAFATTLKAHNKNIRKLQQKRAAQKSKTTLRTTIIKTTSDSQSTAAQ